MNKLDQANSLLKTIKASLKSGEIAAESSVIRERLKTCQECPLLKKEEQEIRVFKKAGLLYWLWNTLPLYKLPNKILGWLPKPSTTSHIQTQLKCSECGCRLYLKLAAKHSSCPKGKW